MKYKKLLICYWCSHNLGLCYKHNQEMSIAELNNIIEDILNHNYQVMIRAHNGKGYEEYLIVYIDNGNFRQR